MGHIRRLPDTTLESGRPSASSPRVQSRFNGRGMHCGRGRARVTLGVPGAANGNQRHTLSETHGLAVAERDQQTESYNICPLVKLAIGIKSAAELVAFVPGIK